MASLSKLALIVSLGLVLLFPPSARAGDMIPPDNRDIDAIKDAIMRALDASETENACTVENVRPYLHTAAAYLGAMDQWLRQAALGRLAQMKSLEEEEANDTNRKNDLTFAIAVQNTLLRSAKLLSDLTAWTEAVSELKDTFAPSSALKNIKENFPSQFDESMKDKFDKLKEAFNATKEGGGDYTEALQNLPPAPDDQSVFSLRGKELADRLNSQVPGTINSLQDLYSAATKLNEQISTVKDYTSFINAEKFADLRTSIVAIGTAIAKFRQGTMVEEVDELNGILNSLNMVWAAARIEANRLSARAEAARAAAAIANDGFDLTACDGSCPPAPKLTPELAFGGTPYPSQGVTYGQALRTFDAATSRKYANAILGKLHGENQADLPSAQLTGGKTTYLVGENVPYSIHRGKTCHAPSMIFVASGKFGHLKEAGPFHTDATSAVTPDTDGEWVGLLHYLAQPKNARYYRTNGVIMNSFSYSRFTFNVVQPKDESKEQPKKPPAAAQCPKSGGIAGAIDEVNCKIGNAGR